MADSAASAVALLCGLKVKARTLGVNEDVTLKVCDNIEKKKLSCIHSWSREQGTVIMHDFLIAFI